MRRHWLIATVAAFGFSMIVNGYFHDRFWLPADDGVYAHVADRMLQGEVLNRDIHVLHPGYIHFANVLAFRLFGADIVSLRYFLVAMNLLETLFVVVLLRDCGPATSAIGAIAFSALSLIQFVNPSASWYCVFLLFGIFVTIGERSAFSGRRLLFIGWLYRNDDVVSTAFGCRDCYWTSVLAHLAGSTAAEWLWPPCSGTGAGGNIGGRAALVSYSADRLVGGCRVRRRTGAAGRQFLPGDPSVNPIGPF